MPWEPYVEFANFVCKFGQDTNLLDLANDVVIPAFLNHDIKYEFMSSTYFLYDTRLLNLTMDGEDVLCLAGFFIQDTTIRSRQTFDADKGLIENPQEMPSATSAIFVLILNNHKLLYYHQTPGAPGLGTFKTVAERNIRAYYNQYVKDRLAERIAQAQNQGVRTKTGLREIQRLARQTLPRMTLEIIPMASEDDFSNFITRLNILTSIKIELIDTNAENDIDPFFDEMREKKDNVNSERTSLTHENRLGLDKEQAVVQLSAAAAQGISRISFIGRDEAGDGIRGNEANYKTRIVLPDTDAANLTDGTNNIYRRIYTAFQNFRRLGIHNDEVAGSDDEATEAKISTIRERHNVSSG